MGTETMIGTQVSRRLHQYIDRRTQRVCDERLFGDALISTLYSPVLERAPVMAQIASSRWVSSALTLLNYNSLLARTSHGIVGFARRTNVDWSECLAAADELSDARSFFERKIRYWDHRPMPKAPSDVVCPADSRVIVGSMTETSGIFVKEKFFDFRELLSTDRSRWLETFGDGDF